MGGLEVDCAIRLSEDPLREWFAIGMGLTTYGQNLHTTMVYTTRTGV